MALEQKQEYDPTRIPQIERPLAKVQVNSFGLSSSPGSSASSSGGLRSLDSEYQIPDFKRSDTASTAASFFSTMSTNTATGPVATPATPRTNRDQPSSPTKSSLSPSKFKDSFDPVTGTWSSRSSYIDDEFSSSRSSHRHVKSVTFDAAPPQINEYEMATPDLSSIGTNSREGSCESDDTDGDRGYYDLAHGESIDESFDASLEDTMKTPVVGPDDYNSYGRGQGRYEASPMPEGTPTMAVLGNNQHKNGPSSVSSSAEHRPLPPVPNKGHQRIKSSDSSSGLSATAERMMNSGQRNLPTPPPASASKSDIQNFGHSKMPLEERLKLMMMSDDGDAKSAAEQQRERRLRRGSARERISSPAAEEAKAQVPEETEADDTIGDMSALGDFQMPDKISRESILRRVNGNKATERPSDFNLSSPAQSPTRSPQRKMEHATIPEDPDIPIPSTEDSILDDETMVEDGSVIINRDAAAYDDDVLDIYEDEDEISILPDDDTYEASVNTLSQTEQSREIFAQTATTEVAVPSVPSPAPEPVLAPAPVAALQAEPVAEPEEVTPKPSSPVRRTATPEKSFSKPEYDGSGWGDDEEYDEEPESPGSVIHHPVDDDDVFEEPLESPTIPEQLATIKASGSKLKTRVSNTPSDIAAMREARRLASHEVPDVPPIPQKHKNRLSRDMSVQQPDAEDPHLERHPSFKNRSLTLDLDTGLSLDKDFERVIEGQKRGYLMRQNTKLVAASDKDGEDIRRPARSVNNSPIKNDRPQSWTVEPWNPATRKKSTSSKATSTGPVPPLPGQESNSVPTRSIAEEDMSMDATTLDGAERGRLFIKVMGVKDLDLPLPRNERTWFSLTLDNGVHCVTTSWLELARNAPIGQEFELVVPNDLEFQLTLNVKLEKPAYLNYPAPSKPSKSKTSTFSKVFASPKKRKEMELRQREEERIAKQHQDALARQRNGTPSGYELLSPIVAEDGSFARSYVCLKEHENRCYGRPYMAEVVCFNEWAEEEEAFASSVKSKRGPGAVIRRAPYKIGKLELQLLFVPRPKNISDEDMPKSMNSCVRELRAAEERLARSWEGHLSQQGGDCPVSAEALNNQYVADALTI